MLTPWFNPFPLQSPELTLSQKIKAKLQNPDLLELCHLVPKEVVQLGEAWEAKMASALCFSSVRYWSAILLILENGSLLNRPGLLASSHFLPASHAVGRTRIHPC